MKLIFQRLFYVDPRSITFFRICLGLLLVAVYLSYVPFLGSLFSDGGALPRKFALDATTSLHLSLYLANGAYLYQLFILLISIVFSFFIVFNYKTRISIVISLILFQSLTYRATNAMFGLHMSLLGVLFWAIFIPFNSDPKRKPFLSLASLGLMVHVFSIIFGAGIAKLAKHQFWLEDEVALHQLSSYYANVNPVTQFMDAIPHGFEVLGPAIVYFEIGIIILFFSPFFTGVLRLVGLALTTLLFVGITMAFHVGPFPLVPMICLYILIPSSFWTWWDPSPMNQTIRTRCIHPTQIIMSRILRWLRNGLSSARTQALWRWSQYFLGGSFLLLFTVWSWNQYAPHGGTFLKSTLQRTPLAKFLEILHLHYAWDWVYDGPMLNHFLVVESQTENGSTYLNMNHAHFRPGFYNYHIKLANSIMMKKRGLSEFAKFFCQDENTLKIRLYEVWDRENKYRQLPETDPPVIKSALNKSIPFYQYHCTTSDGLPPRIIHDRIQDLTEGEILFWEQEFGELQLNRSVDNNPIYLGGIAYSKGFGTHAYSKIKFFVAGASRFTAVVGIDDERSDSPYASVIVKIEADGKNIFRSEKLTGTTPPLKIDLDIKGVDQLDLVVEDAGMGRNANRTYDDHLSWGAPTLFP